MQIFASFVVTVSSEFAASQKSFFHGSNRVFLLIYLFPWIFLQLVREVIKRSVFHKMHKNLNSEL